jgi:phage-related protein
MRDGSVRSVIATCTDISIDSKYFQITFTKVKIKFKAHAYFYDGNSDIYVSEDLSGDTSHLVNITGSVETSAIIYIVPSAGSSITRVRIDTSEYIEVNTPLTHTLKIDSESMDVTMNNSSIDYTGTFPMLNP